MKKKSINHSWRRLLNFNLSKRISAVVILVLLALVTIINYELILPQTYDLSPGAVSDVDIVLPRSVIDRAKTEEKAEKAFSQVPDQYYRAEEIAQANQKNVETFLQLLNAERERISHVLLRTENEAQTLTVAEQDQRWKMSQEQEDKAMAVLQTEFVTKALASPSEDDVRQLLRMVPSTYTMVSGHLNRLVQLITKEELSSASLNKELEEHIAILLEMNAHFSQEYQLVGRVLKYYIHPNLVFNDEATKAAREEARKAAEANPVLLERGTKIVTLGETITKEQYQVLKDAGLLDSGVLDWSLFLGTLLNVLLIFVATRFFLREKMEKVTNKGKAMISILVTMLIPYVFTAYATNYTPFAAPVYFAAIVLTAYFGIRTALVLSTILILLIFPMNGANFHFLFCAVFGVLVSALVSDGMVKRDRYAVLIFSTGLAPALLSLALDLILKTSTGVLLVNLMIFGATGALSAVVAIGIMPLYEMFLDAVSPLRLIELSNQNHPLLKRMLVEAPGTSQHSMMVANLAEVAAEEIGAKSLLARVGAMYHDIGKMENPEFFTENQSGVNPHDLLTPQESARIIFAHVTDGVILAKQNHLPEALLAFITEHHGDTLLFSIYHKACEQADAAGLPRPDEAEFRYPGQKPQSKETGIVMLADSVEAAMKSTGYRDLVKAEELIRKIVKDKNAQNQLIDSGLSYQEVEKIIRSFLKVYAGQFHERIKYPDANSISKK